LERKEAVALLKELVSLSLVEASFVVVKENKPGKFGLILKTDCNAPGLKQFIAERDLAIEDDKQKDYCIIYKR
jgi:hypothetical protein